MLDEGNAFSETESKLAELISQVTGSSIADINRHSSLYRLGLDSISAISLSRKMKHAGFGQVDVSAIMRNDCVARLARILEFGTVSDLEPLGPQASNLSSLFNTEFSDDVKASANNSGRKVMKILPCTPLQEAMLLAQRTEPGAAYFNHLTFEVCADIPSLKNAWTAIVARHDILRTIFTPTNDARFSFAQVVLESVDLVWEELETSSTNNGAAVSLQESHIVQNENCLLGFVTSRDVDTGTTQLHIFIHHALYDGESMALLLHEVEQVLLCNPLPPVVPYDLYLEEMASTDVQQADRFWEGCLSQMSFDHLIVPQPLLERPEAREFDRTLDRLTIPLQEIEDRCKALSVTLLNILEAAWTKTIYHYSGETDICFGEVLSCRSLPVEGVEHIVGPCFNTLPVRIKVPRNAMNLDLMKLLQQTKGEMLPYQLTSLRRLQSRFRKNRLPLFDTLLLLQHEPLRLNEKIWNLIGETGDMDFPLVVEITPDRLTGKTDVLIHFESNKIPPEDAQIVMRHFIELVHHTLSYPSARVMDFDFGTADAIIPSFIHAARGERETAGELSVDNNAISSATLNTDEWSEEEIEIRHLLSSLSRIEAKMIKIETTIFQLGLDSINAIQIAHRLRSLGYEITASDIMEVS
jgi:aryl carrier-like protein